MVRAAPRRDLSLRPSVFHLTAFFFSDIVPLSNWRRRRRDRKSGTQRGARMVGAPCVRGGRYHSRAARDDRDGPARYSGHKAARSHVRAFRASVSRCALFATVGRCPLPPEWPPGPPPPRFPAPPEMPPGSARPVFRLRTSLPACSRALRASASRSALLASRVGPWDVYLRLTPDTLRGEAFRFAPTKPCRGGPCGRPGQRSCPQDTQGGHHDVRRSEKQRIYL